MLNTGPNSSVSGTHWSVSVDQLGISFFTMIRSWSRCQVHQKSNAAGIPVKRAVAIAAIQPTMISLVSSRIAGLRRIVERHSVHTLNSVRINQHTCGTLIADLVDALSLLASTSQSKDWKSLPRPVVECIKVLGVCVAKESGFDQQKFSSARSRRSGISTQGGKRRGNRLAPAKRRVADIGGVIPRPVESLPHAPVPVVPLPWTPGRLCPRLNAYVTTDSRQNSCAAFAATISHSTRSRGPGTRVGWSPPVVPQTDFARGIAEQ
jgi:hypothetical protein